MNEMNTDNIDALLKKFYDGTTTGDEERILAEYFRSTSVLPERYAADRDIILALHNDSTENAIPVPDDLELRLNYFIDNLAADCNKASCIEPAQESTRSFIGFNWRAITSIAACIALLVGAFITFYAEYSINNDNTENNMAQNSKVISIDTIKRSISLPTEDLASASNTQGGSADAKPTEMATADAKPKMRHSKKRSPRKAEIDAVEVQLAFFSEPQDLHETTHTAEIALFKIAQRLDRTATTLDITKSKIELIPISIESTN